MRSSHPFFSFVCLLLLEFHSLSESLSMMSTPRKQLLQNVRVELFFKNIDELRRRVNFLSSEYGIKSFNLVNKSNQDTVLKWVDIIHQEVGPESSVCAHYS